MPRHARTGAIHPVRYSTRKRLKDGTMRVYEGYHAKVNGRWVTAKTYRECDAKIRRALDDIGRWGASPVGKTTFGAYAAQWLELKRAELKPNSVTMYRSAINALERYADVPLSDVTPSMVKRMLAGLRNTDGTTPSYSHRLAVHGVLNGLFRAAVADRLIPSNPASSAKPKQPASRLGATPVNPSTDGRTGEQHRTAFTPAQMRSMLEASSGDVTSGARQWWRLLTGMRQGEILGATLDDLELWRDATLESPGGPEIWVGKYTVNWKLEKLNRIHGCGLPEHGVYPCGRRQPSKCPQALWDVPDGYDMIHLTGAMALTPPKSHRGKIVPIIPQLGAVMHRYLEATRDMPNPYNLVFRQPDGMPIRFERDRADFRDLMRDAGIPDFEHRYGHECRNSVVSLLFSMGVDAGIIQRIVGHSSLAMSEHYRTVPIEDLMHGMETIGEGLDLKQVEWGGSGTL